MMKTREAMDKFMASRKERNLTLKTLSSYDWSLKKLEARFPDELPQDPREIRDFFVELEYLSDSSLIAMWRRLSTFFGWIEREEKSENPMNSVEPPRERRKLPRTLSRIEVAHLLAAAKCPRDYAILVVLLDTGMRVGELASMRHSHITANVVSVMGKGGERKIPISYRARELIRELGDGDYIWVGRQGPLTESGLQRIVRVTMERSGLKPPKLGPHTLRHTMATQFIDDGGEAFFLQKILGHANLETTLLYVHLSMESVQKAHERHSMIMHMGELTPPTEKLIVDPQVFVDAGKKSGAIRRAKNAARDRRITDMVNDGLDPHEIATMENLHHRTVRRIAQRENRKASEGGE